MNSGTHAGESQVPYRDVDEAGGREIGLSAIATRGLTPAEVHERVLAGQVNTQPPAPGRTIAQIVRANVLTRFNAILGALFVVVVIVGPPQDALFGVILVVNTSIGVGQQLRAKRALDKLAILTAARARVLRGGAVAEIRQDEVVLGDVLDLRRGDQVPVDAHVVAAEGVGSMPAPKVICAVTTVSQPHFVTLMPAEALAAGRSGQRRQRRRSGPAGLAQAR